jgi:hypothetical protein
VRIPDISSSLFDLTHTEPNPWEPVLARSPLPCWPGAGLRPTLVSSLPQLARLGRKAWASIISSSLSIDGPAVAWVASEEASLFEPSRAEDVKQLNDEAKLPYWRIVAALTPEIIFMSGEPRPQRHGFSPSMWAPGPDVRRAMSELGPVAPTCLPRGLTGSSELCKPGRPGLRQRQD